MIILERPYVSDLLFDTIRKNRFPVIGNEYAMGLRSELGDLVIEPGNAIERIQRSKDAPLIYTTSENAIGWISRNLGFTDLPEKIDLFKDKVKFREMIRPMYPDYYFREVPLDYLDDLDHEIDTIPIPFIIKPSVGFFSMGVHRVDDREEWDSTKRSILEEIKAVKDLYPEEVLKTKTFIIEEVINGEEFAMDAYYDKAGEPVILSILRHSFATECDMSDRIYQSSKEIIEKNLEEFTAFLEKIGTLAGIRSFPVHVEVRREENGRLIPIEINPMRFGGWCTTPDLTTHAYDLNPYEYFFGQKRPDWDKILAEKEGKVYSIVILDNSTRYPADRIGSFDYDRVLAKFSNPLELRRVDHHEYPVFGILFVETEEAEAPELEELLHSDLSEYVHLLDE